jgi:hypothetical protein
MPTIFFVVDTVEIVGSYDIVKSGKQIRSRSAPEIPVPFGLFLLPGGREENVALTLDD